MVDQAAAAAQLAALHAQLSVLLPDLLRLEDLLRSSLACRSTGGSELAPLLQQRLQQCGAAVTLLRGLPAGAAGREHEGVQALAAAKPFIESSAAMIRDVQNLMAVLVGPEELQEVLSLGTTERTWQRHGIQLQRAPPRPPPDAEQQLAAQQQQQQQQLWTQQQAQAPLGLPLQQQEQQQLLLQQQQQDRGMPQAQLDQLAMPPPPAVAWAQAGPATSAAATAAPPPGLPVTTSFDMLPTLPSVGVLPSLSQLLEEPMMTLSIQDDELTTQAAAAAIAAVQWKAGGAAPGMGQQQQQQQAQQQAQQPGALQQGGPQPSIALIERLLNPWGAAGPPQPARQQQQAVQAARASSVPQTAAAQLGSGLARAPSAPLSPNCSGEQPQLSGGSGSLSYRRVSFAPRHAAARSSLDDGLSPGSGGPSAAPPGLSFAPRPVAAPSASGSGFLARPPSSLGNTGELAAGGVQAGAGAAATRVNLVQPVTGAVRIAISAAAPVPAAEPAPDGGKEGHTQFTTAGTADGPVSYVSVHEAPGHEFSQGETSLSRLFYEAKLTGVLPAPEDSPAAGGSEANGGDSSASQSGRVSSQQGSGPGSRASCVDSGGAGSVPTPVETVRKTRAAARRAVQAGGAAAASLPPPPPQEEEEIAGTKRHKAGGGG